MFLKAEVVFIGETRIWDHLNINDILNILMKKWRHSLEHCYFGILGGSVY